MSRESAGSDVVLSHKTDSAGGICALGAKLLGMGQGVRNLRQEGGMSASRMHKRVPLSDGPTRQVETKRFSTIGKLYPLPNLLQEEFKKRCGDILPTPSKLDAATKRITLYAEGLGTTARVDPAHTGIGLTCPLRCSIMPA